MLLSTIIYLFIACLLSIFIGYIIGTRIVKTSAMDVIGDLERALFTNNTSDRTTYLGILRFKLANELINRDPDMFLQNYSYLLDVKKELDSLSEDEVTKRYQAISQEYKHFIDFDIINTKDNILHTDALNTVDDDTLFNTYNDLVTYHILQSSAFTSHPSPLFRTGDRFDRTL